MSPNARRRRRRLLLTVEAMERRELLSGAPVLFTSGALASRPTWGRTPLSRNRPKARSPRSSTPTARHQGHLRQADRLQQGRANRPRVGSGQAEDADRLCHRKQHLIHELSCSFRQGGLLADPTARSSPAPRFPTQRQVTVHFAANFAVRISTATATRTSSVRVE